MAEKKNDSSLFRHAHSLSFKMYFAVIFFAVIAGGRAGVINYRSGWSCEISALGKVEIKKGGAYVNFGKEARHCPKNFDFNEYLTVDTTDTETHSCQMSRGSEEFEPCESFSESECYTVFFNGLENAEVCSSLRQLLGAMGGPRRKIIVHNRKSGGSGIPSRVLGF